MSTDEDKALVQRFYAEMDAGNIDWWTSLSRRTTSTTIPSRGGDGLRWLTGRPEARAQDAQPTDLAVALGQVGLLLDQAMTVRTLHAEAISDALAVCEGVTLEEFDRLNQVVLAKPLLEHADDLVGASRVPDIRWRHRPEVDLGMDELADTGVVLGRDRTGELLAEALIHAPTVTSVQGRLLAGQAR